MMYTRFSLFVSLGFLTLSCSRPSHRTTTTPYLSAAPSGRSSFYATGANLNAHGAVGSGVKIDGLTSGTFPELEISFITYPGATGTYPITSAATIASYSYSGSSLPSAVYGSVTITAISPDLVGTFNFTTGDSVHVSGSFDVVVTP